jgi:hypothetical protein
MDLKIDDLLEKVSHRINGNLCANVSSLGTSS